MRMAPKAGPLELAVDSMVDSLGDRLTQDHAAHVAGLRRLAQLIDVSGGADDKLWREYRLLLNSLMGLVAPEDGRKDAVDRLLDRLAQVGDVTEP